MKIIVQFIILIFMCFNVKVFAQQNSDVAHQDSIFVAGTERTAASIKPPNPEVKIYPNPTDGELTIEFDNSNNDEKIELLDILGNKILETPYHKTLNLAFLARGVYFLKLLDKNNRLIVMERIIKK